MALGFARLAINGVGAVGRQPHQHDGLVGAINGEIYNHRELRRRYDLASSECDTDVILPLMACNGPRSIDDLGGLLRREVAAHGRLDGMGIQGGRLGLLSIH